MSKIAIPFLPGRSSFPNYINALVRSGAECEAGPEIHPESCDGLLLPGGLDVDPAFYSQDPGPLTESDSVLDEFQLEVFYRFLELGKPIFGICRGHQLINVALGGTLIQHLPSAADHKQFPSGEDRIHDAEAIPGSFISRLYGIRFTVNSSHHQGVALPGRGLHAVLHAPDGTVEALEHESLPIWTVQFHPERMAFSHRRNDTVDGSLLFRFFLGNCGER